MSDEVYTEFWNGQLLELVTSEEKTYYTQLIRKESELLIQRPVNKQNVPMLIENGMTVTVCFHDDKKGLCNFASQLHLQQNGKIAITKPSIDAIKVVQRRQFFRVKVMLDMDLTLPPAEDANPNAEEAEGENITVITHDISGGGAAFTTESKIVEIGDKVEGTLYLKTKDNQQKIVFKGNVVNVIKQSNNMYKNALQFIDMREGTRSHIVKFCIAKQIEIRNKIKE